MHLRAVHFAIRNLAALTFSVAAAAGVIAPATLAAAEPVGTTKSLIAVSRLGIAVREFPIEVTAPRRRPSLIPAAMITYSRQTLLEQTRAVASTWRENADGGDYLPVTYVGVNFLNLP